MSWFTSSATRLLDDANNCELRRLRARHSRPVSDAPACRGPRRQGPAVTCDRCRRVRAGCCSAHLTACGGAALVMRQKGHLLRRGIGKRAIGYVGRRQKETDVSISRWLKASHGPEVAGNRGLWWVAAHTSPGIVPPPTRSDQHESAGQRSFRRWSSGSDRALVIGLSSVGQRSCQ